MVNSYSGRLFLLCADRECADCGRLNSSKIHTAKIEIVPCNRLARIC